MSPEDLINLSTPREDFEHLRRSDGRGKIISVPHDELEPSSQPSTVKKVAYADRDDSRPRGSSRTASRARSPDKRNAPLALDLRGRSASRGPPSTRSPSSPQPMSARLQQHQYASDDEEDYRQAVEAQERFRRRNNRSASRASRGEGPTSPVSVRSAAWSTRSEGVRRTASQAGTDGSSRPKIGAPTQTPAPMQLVTDSSGDLKVIKDERQLKKEAAARELEERRKSLARRPSAPPIMHPDEISAAPTSRTPPSLMELPSTTYVPPGKEGRPSRSASVDSTAGRSMYANRDGPRIGLPATPRAMRLVMESEAGRRNVPIPPIPAPSRHDSPGRQSPPKKTAEEEPQTDDIPMILPSTVYTPPPAANSRLAAQIGRSSSAPPQDLVQPHGHSHHGHSRAPSAANSLTQGRRPSHDANAFSSWRPSHDANAFSSRRPSHDAAIPPPPPPPVPPMLKELQHLAQPPPPPPAPLPHHAAGPKPVVYGGSSGLIEIVMDDDQQHQQPQQQEQQQQQQQQQQEHSPSQSQQHPPPLSISIPTSEATVPILSPPDPRQPPYHHHATHHTRGRSSVDITTTATATAPTNGAGIGGRLSRATERMRSASRSRAPGAGAGVGAGGGPAVQVQTQVFQQVQAQVAEQEGRNEFRTGLHQSEMI
jgi:hypothetical protein